MSNNVIGKIGVGLILFGAVGALVFLDKPKRVVYDCSIAEWHPDYPKEVKEECRKIRARHSIHT